MASVGSQLISHFNAPSRGANVGKNDHGVPIVWLLLSMEPSGQDNNIATTANSNGFDLRGLDALTDRTTGVRAGSSFFNGYAPSVTPSQLSSANRRQIAILNNLRHSPGKALRQILVNDHPDGALTTAEATAMRTAINSVLPGNAPPVISDVIDLTIPRDTMTAPLAVTISDAETAASALTFTATAADAVLLPPANILLGGSGMARTVQLTPAAGRSGSTLVTLSVSDGTNTVIDTFTLTVTDPYNTWADAEGLTAANRAPADDPDGDNVLNLFEYFAGTPPLTASPPPELRMENGQPHYVFQRHKTTGISWNLEAGTDLATLTPWTPPAGNVTVIDLGAVERLHVRLPAGTRGFVRLSVSQ